MEKLRDGTILTLQTFELYEKPYSLNEYRNENHFKLNKIKTFWTYLVYNTIKIFRIRPVKRANVQFIFNFKTKTRRDADNMSATIKFIMDALVNAEILIDDSFSYVERLEITKGDLKKDSIIVNIWGDVSD